VPLGYFYIKNIIVEVLDVLQVLNELALEFEEILSVLRTLDTSKDWHHEVVSLSGELELSLANLHEIFASLDEGFVFSEDSIILVEVPSWLRGVLLELLLAVNANILPLLAAINALLEVTHAFFNIAIEHIILIDSCSASLNDLVTDLGE